MLGFLDVPAEVRIQIYQLLFYNAKCKIPIYLGSKQNAMNCNRSFNPVILRLNKTIYQEASEEFYGKNDFYMRPFTQENQLPTLSDQACHLIHHLSIHLDGSEEETQTFKDTWTIALVRLPALSEIRILFNHMRSFLLETIVSVTETLAGRYVFSATTSPQLKLDLTIGATPTIIQSLQHTLPWCAQDHTIWTNDSFYDFPHNKDRVFDMAVLRGRAMPKIAIEAVTDPHEFSAIMHYRAWGWSFEIDQKSETTNRIGSRYLASFRENYGIPSSGITELSSDWMDLVE